MEQEPFTGASWIIMRVTFIDIDQIYMCYIWTFKGTFENGSMTGNGVYYLADGGKFDSSVGLYYPDREDASVFHEAHFDGHNLRYKQAQQAKQLQGGY